MRIELYQIPFFPLKSSPNKKQTRRFREGHWNIRRGEVCLLACDTAGMAVTNPSHSWRSRGWLVCFHFVEGKATKGKSWSRRKNFKDAKVSSTFEVQAASTHQQNRNQSCGAFCLSWIAMTYYYEATSLLNQDTLTRFNATSKLLEKNMSRGSFELVTMWTWFWAFLTTYVPLRTWFWKTYHLILSM